MGEMTTKEQGGGADLRDVLGALEAGGLRRSEIVHGGRGEGSSIIVGGRELVNLSSNDYLGLAVHPAVIEAACEAARRWGGGSGASRMICGTTTLHAVLEERLRDFLGAPACLVFGSGYLANVGMLGAVAGRGGVIFSDRLNHASIIDGCRLSRARVRIYDHRAPGHLTSLLEEERGSAVTKIVVTETTFSMEGDEAPLAEISGLAREHGALLVADEAHSIGIKGDGGAGMGAMLDPDLRPGIVMGTLGKAFGSYGAFACGSGVMREFLVNACRTLIYSTSLPPAVTGASLKGLEIIRGREGEELRGALRRNCGLMKEAIAESCWGLPGTQGPIFLLKAGSPDRAVRLERRFMDEGIFLRAIRYPTVPEGTERLRIVVSALLTPLQMEKTAEALRKAGAWIE
jgi:8-amino-7-oxononanoate synthase